MIFKMKKLLILVVSCFACVSMMAGCGKNEDKVVQTISIGDLKALLK